MLDAFVEAALDDDEAAGELEPDQARSTNRAEIEASGPDGRSNAAADATAVDVQRRDCPTRY